MTTKAVFELEMEDDDYQHMLERIEGNGFYVLPVFRGIVVRKQESEK